MPVLALVFAFAMVNAHELGHTVLARFLGDRTAHYVLYEATATRSCFGCNFYDSSRLSDVANIVVSFGGVVASQFLCWIAIAILALAPRRPGWRWLLFTVVAVTWLGDLVFQLEQGLTAEIPPQLTRGPETTYTDYVAVIWFARDATGASLETLKLSLLVGTIAYTGLLVLVLRWAAKRGAGSPSEVPRAGQSDLGAT